MHTKVVEIWLPYILSRTSIYEEKNLTLAKEHSLYSLQNNVNKNTERSQKYFSRLKIIGAFVAAMLILIGVSECLSLIKKLIMFCLV